MSDVNQFVDALSQDVSGTVVPKVQELAETVGTRAIDEYGPRISAFANQLVKDIIQEQSATVTAFATTLIQDLFRRYSPELVGEVHATIVQGALQLQGQGTKLDLKRRDTGSIIASLDLPLSIRINLPPIDVALQHTTVKLDVVR
jgi:hypothetical protein